MTEAGLTLKLGGDFTTVRHGNDNDDSCETVLTCLEGRKRRKPWLKPVALLADEQQRFPVTTEPVHRPLSTHSSTTVHNTQPKHSSKRQLQSKRILEADAASDQLFYEAVEVGKKQGLWSSRWSASESRACWDSDLKECSWSVKLPFKGEFQKLPFRREFLLDFFSVKGLGEVRAGSERRGDRKEGKKKKRGKKDKASQPEREMDSTELRRLRERPARRRWASFDSPGGERPKPPVGGDGSGVSSERGGPQRSSMLQAIWC